MNNFELISHATTDLNNPSFHPKITLLINQILSSKRRAVPRCIKPDMDIHLAHRTPVNFLHVATYLENMYGKDQLVHHSLCFYQGVPFKIHQSTNKQVDNSAVLYSDKWNNLRIGIIVGIIRLKVSNDLIFVIDQAQVLGNDSFSILGTKFINELCVYAKMPDPPNTNSITYDSIKEKVAYRMDRNKKQFYEFNIFPNLLEST